MSEHKLPESFDYNQSKYSMLCKEMFPEYVDFWICEGIYRHNNQPDFVTKTVSWEKLPVFDSGKFKLGATLRQEIGGRKFFCGADDFSPTVKNIADYLTKKYKSSVRGISISIHLNFCDEPVLSLAPAWSFLDKNWAGEEITREFGVIIQPGHNQNTLKRLVQEIDDACGKLLKEMESI